VCGSGEAAGRAMTPDCICERCLRTVPMSIRRAGPGATLHGGAHPAGRSGCSGRLHPSSQPGQGALRLANDQGRTAQNVPICVAYTASHDVGKAAQIRRQCARSPQPADVTGRVVCSAARATWSPDRSTYPTCITDEPSQRRINRSAQPASGSRPAPCSALPVAW